MATSALPSRTGTQLTTRSSRSSDDEALAGEDTTEVTRIFNERLTAWRNVVSHLEDYVTATEKLHHGQGKDYEKITKSVSKPLKTPEQFDQNLGGINGFLDNIRTNTQAISNSHNETSKVLKESVIPVFTRLDKEIKAKSKELVKGAGKGSKAVDKARLATQKHIEALGQGTANFESRGAKGPAAADDPYVVSRGIVHRLNKQLVEENANRQDLLAVQNNFASFEAHIIQSIQNGLGQFNTVISKQTDITKNLYGDIVANAQRMPVEYEWIKFLERNSAILIDPQVGPRDISSVIFPNQNHRATQPLISGSLGRKSKLLRKYDTNYVVVTPSKFLHEFKSDDNIAKDPVPEISLYLPDCTVGQCIGDKFAIKGKDSSKGPMGMSIHTTHEYNFKAHTAADALKWWEIIRSATGHVTNEVPAESAPTSPISPVVAEGEKFGTIPPQESGTTAQPAVASAATAHPAVAAAETHPSAASEKAALAAGEGHPAHAGTAGPVTGTSVPVTQAPLSNVPAPTSAEPPAKS